MKYFQALVGNQGQLSSAFIDIYIYYLLLSCFLYLLNITEKPELFKTMIHHCSILLLNESCKVVCISIVTKYSFRSSKKFSVTCL